MTATATAAPRRSLPRRILRWAGRLVLGVLFLVFAGVGAVYGVSERRMRAKFAIPDHPLAVTADAATLERGKHAIAIRGCQDCHGANFGGHIMVDDPLLGRLTTANLTDGRAQGPLTPRQFELAVRHGIREDGSPLLVMPSGDYQGIDDEDLAAMYAYLRSRPPVRETLPAMQIRPLGRALYLADKIPLVPAARLAAAATHAPAPPVGTTPEYGRYLAQTCTGCHNERFSGGRLPAAPPEAPLARNLTPDSTTGIGRWDEERFVTTLVTGRRPDGTMVDTTHMPIPMTRAMTDTERRAIWRYLRTVPARRMGE